MMILVAERRIAPRLPSSGPVEIFFDNPTPMSVHGELVETSATGFRATHQCKTLEAGVEIAYAREGQAGRARVVWTMVSGDRRVSGFMLL